MKKLMGIVVAVGLVMLTGSTVGSAQQTATTVAVDISKAKLSWNWAVGDGGPATSFNVKCGSATGVYTLITSVPATGSNPVTVPIATVTPNAGTYFCVVTAVNAFGESSQSNEVSFATGLVPVAPTNLVIQAQ